MALTLLDLLTQDLLACMDSDTDGLFADVVEGLFEPAGEAIRALALGLGGAVDAGEGLDSAASAGEVAVGEVFADEEAEEGDLGVEAFELGGVVEDVTPLGREGRRVERRWGLVQFGRRRRGIGWWIGAGGPPVLGAGFGAALGAAIAAMARGEDEVAAQGNSANRTIDLYRE